MACQIGTSVKEVWCKHRPLSHLEPWWCQHPVASSFWPQAIVLVQDVRNQGRLAAEAEQHAREVTERNRFMRRIAAQSGVMQLPGQSQASRPYTCCLHRL